MNEWDMFSQKELEVGSQGTKGNITHWTFQKRIYRKQKEFLKDIIGFAGPKIRQQPWNNVTF